VRCRICWKRMRKPPDLNSLGQPALSIGTRDGKRADAICRACGMATLDRDGYEKARRAIDRAAKVRARARRRTR
jgi:hypothetical protein